MILVESKNQKTGRTAIIEANGSTGWFYLTAANALKPVADVWLFNLSEPVLPSDTKSVPPLAPEEFHATPMAVYVAPGERQWEIIWSGSGEAAFAMVDGFVLAMLHAKQKVGYCQNLSKDGPWGKVWENEIYRAWLLEE